MQYKILVIEDEPDINRLLAKILNNADYHVTSAYSGTEAKLLLEKESPDLILLDLMLPGISGEQLLNMLRKEKYSNIPAIVISAKNSLDNKVTLLKGGADDYITKPFEPEEVLARVQALLRRSGRDALADVILVHKKMKLNPSSRKVTVDNTELPLTAHEFDILLLLMQNPQKVYSRENLYELVWHGGYYGENNTVNVHVSNIRKKIKEILPEEEYIQTVYGIGFKLA